MNEYVTTIARSLEPTSVATTTGALPSLSDADASDRLTLVASSSRIVMSAEDAEIVVPALAPDSTIRTVSSSSCTPSLPIVTGAFRSPLEPAGHVSTPLALV